MSKELIFMGRAQGKVRLALFDGGHGTARKLPVKEITEDDFVAGIKSGRLPVRGFGVNKGRVTCKFGSWYTLPEVTDAAGLSLFGTVYFGEENRKVVEDSGAETVAWYGLASVDWCDGMFRIVSPSTLAYLASHRRMTVYTYGGPLTRTRLKIIDTAAADYVYPECDSSETLEDVIRWMDTSRCSDYAFLQWIYQRCEYVGSVRTGDVDKYMTDGRSMRSLDVALMGSRPVAVLDVPGNIYHLYLREGRKIDVFDAWGSDSLFLHGCTDFTVKCSGLHALGFNSGTRAKLVREGPTNSMSVTGWEGWEGSGGDYCGLDIDNLSSCFRMQPSDPKLIFDANSVGYSFTGITTNIEFTKRLGNIHSSFTDFNGSVTWKGADRLSDTFWRCAFTSPLDMRESRRISDAVNEVTGGITLPDCFTHLGRKVFNGTDIKSVKYTPEGVYGIDIMNDRLSVDISVADKERTAQFTYGEVGSLTFSTLSKQVPKFSRVSFLPDNIVTGVDTFGEDTFNDMGITTLDLRKFPDTTALPEAVAYKCKFSTVIVGDNIKAIATRAFVECDSIRWVYLPASVTDIGVFIQRPRIPYTIFTQQASAADKYAKKYKIEVRYVDSPEQFTKAIQEIPEELEGAVAVAILTGSGDGESGAVKLACEVAGYAEDLYDKYSIRETCAVPLSEVAWISTHEYLKAQKLIAVEYPRLHILLSYIANSSEYHSSIKDIGRQYRSIQYWYRCGDYMMGCTELETTGNTADLVWAIVKDETVIHMFTEKVSSVESGGAVKRALEQAHKLDMDATKPTNIASTLMHTNFTGRGISVCGKTIDEVVGTMAKEAVKRTFVPLGVYQLKANVRGIIGVDVTTLELWAFKLSSGKSLDIRKSSYRSSGSTDLWQDAQEAIGSAMQVQDLTQWKRMYSELGGSDKVVDTLMGVETVKIDSYDMSLPEAEIAALRVIDKVYQDQFQDEKTVSLAELRAALNASGIARVMTASGWKQLQSHMYGSGLSTETVVLSDGKCYIRSLSGVSWFVFSGDGAETAVTVALELHGLFKRVQGILEVYNNLPNARPIDREEHFAHVNCMLPHREFYQLRVFGSGGSYTDWGDFSMCVAVSKISGKPCVAATCLKGVVPIFWTNTFAGALRIFELCGLMGFSYNHEWLYNKHNSMCSDLFSSKENFETGVPDYKNFYTVWKNTREALQRGESDDYLCVTGIQEIFNLSVKHPPVSGVTSGL